MSSVKLGFNVDLFNYLLHDGSFLLNDTESLSDSELYQRKIQLNVPETYLNTPIYIPLQADWTGRIYTTSIFANYQGDDLSLSLIEFWDGKPLSSEGLDYLYLHGANVYNEDNISKSTNENRIKWTISNLKNILEMKEDWMSKAENKFSFAAFCLLMRRLNTDSNYPVKLPIFLDATCSGIQHLGALIRDEDLADKVNLTFDESKIQTGPKDIYDILKEPINEEIRRTGGEESLYSNLEYINLTRKIVKIPIMTKTYNVSVMGIFFELKSATGLIVSKKYFNVLRLYKEEIKIITIYKFPSIYKEKK